MNHDVGLSLSALSSMLEHCTTNGHMSTVHLKKYAHGLSFIVFYYNLVPVHVTHILQKDYVPATGATIRLPQCQGGNLKEYGL